MREDNRSAPMMDLMVVLIVFATIINALILIASTVILRGCMKMYTEYFKGRSIRLTREQ